MPRGARLVLPGALYHITQRGNYRQEVFGDQNDRIQYLRYLEKYSHMFALDIYAYCLMDNHVHLIVRPQKKESLGQTICRAHQRYSLYYHAKNKMHGHLWQERYYSCALFGKHIQEAIRYVERNPVRARMVQMPWDYAWSSARAHTGKKYRIITLADISEYIQAPSWKYYLMKEQDEKWLELIRGTTMKGLILGHESIIKKIELQLGRKILPNKRGRPKLFRNQ